MTPRKTSKLSNIAHQARELRLERGLSQAALSRLTGVATADISRFECGRSAPTMRTIDKLAIALGARVVLVPGKAPKGSIEPVPQGRTKEGD